MKRIRLKSDAKKTTSTQGGHRNALIVGKMNDPSELNSKIDELLNTLGYAVI